MKAIRKHVVPRLGDGPTSEGAGLSVADTAEVFVTSEAFEHPVDHIFDGREGPGASRWVASVPGDQIIILAFLQPQSIDRIRIEVEELTEARTQEMTISLSENGGHSYKEARRQEYTFSPTGATFEREEWVLQTSNVTHLRIWIRPHKGGEPVFATLTSLRLE